MKSITIERIIIASLLILLFLVFLFQSGAQNPNKFEFYVVNAGVVFRLNKETGEVHFIHRNKIFEWGTQKWIYNDTTSQSK